jgi:hypothetical protein
LLCNSVRISASVLHADPQAWGIGARVEGQGQQDFALAGLAQGVFQQAQERLAQARRIATDDPWDLRLGETDELDVLLLGLGPVDVEAVLDQGVEVELHVVQFDLP